MCPQSLFKLKPDFDLVLRDILLAFGNDSNNLDQVFGSSFLLDWTRRAEVVGSVGFLGQEGSCGPIYQRLESHFSESKPIQTPMHLI